MNKWQQGQLELLQMLMVSLLSRQPHGDAVIEDIEQQLLKLSLKPDTDTELLASLREHWLHVRLRLGP